jgi:hypothetical protein
MMNGPRVRLWPVTREDPVQVDARVGGRGWRLISVQNLVRRSEHQTGIYLRQSTSARQSRGLYFL